MRKVILQEFVTIDGFAAESDGGMNFMLESNDGDEKLVREQIKLLQGVDTILLGRKTYEMFAGYWPNVKEGSKDKEIADLINAKERIVFSNTLDSAPWGEFTETTVIKTRADTAISEMKNEPGKDMIIWGSLSVAQSLMNEGLIDEYRLVTCPVALGSGRSLFSDGIAPIKLTLEETYRMDRGSVELRYKPAKDQ